MTSTEIQAMESVSRTRSRLQTVLKHAGEASIWTLLVVTWGFLLLLVGLGPTHRYSGWVLIGHLISLFAFAPALFAHAVRLFPWRSQLPRVRLQALLSTLYLPAVLCSGWLFVWSRRAA